MLVRILLISFYGPSDSMNRNGKWMKLKATRLTEIQPIETFVEYESGTDFLHNRRGP